MTTPTDDQLAPGERKVVSAAPAPTADRPKLIYHYTDEAGVLGIVDAAALHATMARFLNDETEIMHAFHRAAKLAASWPSIEGPVRDGLALFVEYVRDVRNVEPNIGVVSFSEDPDVLSQWRGYGGYAIGFDRSTLESRQDGWRLVQCCYDHDVQDRLLRAAIEQAIHESARPPDSQPATPQKVFGNLHRRVLDVAPAIKHRGFHEEKEWRLVSPSIDATKLRTRRGRHSLIQYAAWALPTRSDGSLPVVEIVVGPGPHQHTARAGVAGLLAAHQEKLGKWSVRGSPTPYLP